LVLAFNEIKITEIFSSQSEERYTLEHKQVKLKLASSATLNQSCQSLPFKGILV